MPGESFEISINEQSLNELINNKLLIGELLNRLFAPGTEGAKKLETALIGYHWFEGGSPDYKHLTIVNNIVDPESLKGVVRFEYTLQKTFGCADIQTQQIKKQQWYFEIDPSSSLILFIGPETDERVDEI